MSMERTGHASATSGTSPARDAGFAPDTPESLPKLHVPGLPDDATGLPPEALSGDVPTLTDSVSPHELASEAFEVIASDGVAQAVEEPVAPAPVAVAPPVVDAPPPEPVVAEEVLEPRVESIPELAVDAPPAAPETAKAPPLAAAEVAEELAAEAETEADASLALAEAAQEEAAAADTWVAQMQIRIEGLTEEIRVLNDRLDRFEKQSKV